MYFTSNLDENDKYSHQLYRYEVDFKAECKDVQFAQEGAFIELSKETMQKIFPTGVAGELEENAFMVRDTGKLLCRLIEDFESRCKIGTGVASLPQGLRFPVGLPGLTDLPQWDNTRTQVFSYSNENLNTLRERPMTADGEHMIVRGEGSIVEEVVQKLRNISNNELPARVILTGKRGVGKSCALNHAVYHARSRGWICIFIPNGWHHVNGGPFIEPAHEATGVPGLFDNPMMSADLLRNFWKAHHQDLRRISLQFPEKTEQYAPHIEVLREAVNRTFGAFSRSGKTFTEVREGEAEDVFADEDLLDAPILNNISNFNIDNFKINNLEDLVLFGIAFRDFAGPVVVDLVRELRAYKNPDQPVLIAIDQFNYWDMPTVYQYQDKKIPAMDICVPHALKFLSQKKGSHPNWEGNGDDHVMCIGATSYLHPINKKRDKVLVTYENNRSSLPLTIDVGGYTHVEFLAALKYYLSIGRIDEGLCNQDILSFRMFCGNNPRTMHREPTTFFFSLQSEYVSAVYDKIISYGGGGGSESMMREVDPSWRRGGTGEEKRYEVVYEEETMAEHDVDLSSKSKPEITAYLTELATEPVRDDLELTNSLPINLQEERFKDIDITFGGRYLNIPEDKDEDS